MRYLFAFVVMSAALVVAMTRHQAAVPPRSDVALPVVAELPVLPAGPAVDPWAPIPPGPPAGTWLDSATAALAFVQELAECRHDSQGAWSGNGLAASCSVATMADGRLVVRDEDEAWIHNGVGDWRSVALDNLPATLCPASTDDLRRATMLVMTGDVGFWEMSAGVPPDATITGSATAGWELRTVTSRSANGATGHSISFSATGAGVTQVGTWSACGGHVLRCPIVAPRLPNDPG